MKKSKDRKGKKKKIIVFKNPEKKDNKIWTEKRFKKNPANFPEPFRMLMIGMPNSGKTNMVKNVLVNRGKDYFEKIFLLHPSGKKCEEYAKIDLTILEKVPSGEEFNRKYKNLLIIDDIELKNSISGKQNIAKVNKLFTFASTHKNLSIILTTQDPQSQIMSGLIKIFNVLIIFKIDDGYFMDYLKRKLNLDSKIFSAYKMLKNITDNITIDRIPNSPAPLRLNLFQKI